MYEEYWNLERSPFRNDLDAEFFVSARAHKAALLKLRYLIENAEGAGVLAGPTGCGKSLLVRALAEQLGETVSPVVHLVFPQMTASELLAYLAVKLGVEEAQLAGCGLDTTLHRLETQLGILNDEKRHPLIVVDDAHLIEGRGVFRALQALLNLQQVAAVSFSLLFAGQPDLLGQLQRIGELDERLALRCLLQPLNDQEVGDYISARLQTAGAGRPLFDEQAMRAVFEHSGGVPRRINRLCDLALLIGFADQLESISAPQIEAVAGEIGSPSAAA